MASRQHYRGFVALLALLLQLHAALAFALPCAGCLDRAQSSAGTSTAVAAVPSCHHRDLPASAAEQSDHAEQRCPHCASGHCGAGFAVGLLDVGLALSPIERVTLVASGASARIPTSLSPPYRPPIA